jgi:hypothetical protein
VQPLDEEGTVLDAEYHVEPDGQAFALILESRGGGEAGSSRPRHPDYNRALSILLHRLARLDSVLVDALVDSTSTRALGLPASGRRIADGPVRLRQEPDLEALRHRMGAAQARVGRSPESSGGGNRTKRIRLRLEVPGFATTDVERLEQALARAVPVLAGARSFILTWNPDRWTWPADELAEAIRVTAAGGSWPESWSVGARKRGITPGDRAFLLRQGRDRRGMVASGVFISGVEADEHWDGSGRPSVSAQVDWDTVLEADDRLPVEVLKDTVPDVSWDRIQGSGISVPESCDQELAQLWAKHRRSLSLPPADDLGVPHQLAWPTAAEVLQSLIGEEIPTVTGTPNTVLAIQGRTVLVGTGRSPQGQPVEISEVQQGMDKLRANGSVRVAVEELGHSSAFIGAVLATLPGAHVTTSPATVTLTTVDEVEARDPEFAVLDSTASVKIRKEQGVLRDILADGRELADCALCGHQYPLRFLVAAHIKKRSVCTDDERRDLRHIAMLACTFGCDALYEAGWITVGSGGRIEPVLPDTAPAGRLRDHLQQLTGRHCQAHNPASEPYFDWHRKTYSPEGP